MRVDQLIHKLCFVKSRNIIKKACDFGLVSINSQKAKASAQVKESDIISFQIYGYQTSFRLLEIPKGNVSKAKAPTFYEMIERKKIES